MGRRKVENRKVRTLTRNNSSSYSVTLPIELVRRLNWRNHQRLVISRRGKHLIVEDWEPK